MAESLPGPSVEKKRMTSGGTRFKFSWTLPENITTTSAKPISLPIASSALAILM